ncbi:MAG: type I-C CRISPR-associated protein Cas7/Csd2 [Dehalococcoidia bacterium]|nr:type I-C CRISPR-associated protein Cas7/Csd2 [Dehalococcoidia bacterium]
MNNNYEQAINNRYDFVLLYDVENGNPNGDPDAGNMPRIDPETGNGIVTDVCIKRKIRNYIETRHGDRHGFDIYIRQNAVLNRQDQRGLEIVKDAKDKVEKSQGFRATMCETFFDIRTFGAVMTTAARDPSLSNIAGQVRGPVQLSFGCSIEPIIPREITITRMAVTNEEDAKRKENEMGRKAVVPYGLYRQEGYISANLARTVTGFSDVDLGIFWDALIHMFDDDRSATRGKMALRELVVFKHDNPLGNAPAHKLFDLVKVLRNEKVAVPRKYSDYAVTVDMEKIPTGVTVDRKYQDSV